MSEIPEKAIVETEGNIAFNDAPETIEPPLDHFLRAIVGMANNGIEVRVTLTVSGFLVTEIV